MIFNTTNNLSKDNGIDVSGVTATASDVRSDKIFVDNSGAEVTGTVATRTSSNVTASGNTVTIPAGIYDTAVSKSITTATQATPSISVSNSGLITASCTQSSGYVSGSTKSATKQLSTKAATTITPSTSNQTISSGYYLTGTQTIQGDSNLVASNIKSGVSIFGVSGSYTGEQIIYESLNGSVSASSARLYTSYSIKTLLCFGCSYVFEWSGYNALWSASGNYSNDAVCYYCTYDGSATSIDYDTGTVTFNGSTISVSSGGLLSNSGRFLNGYVAYIPA